MNWDAVSAVGEIAGALAVVASLAYLAVQIKAQSRESRAAAMHEISAGFRDNIAQFASTEMADLFMKGNADIESLNETERFRLVTCMQRVIRVWEEAYIMHINGRLDDNFWIPMNKQYSSMLATPSVRYVWDLRREFYNDEFREFVDSTTVLEYRL